MSDKPLWQDLGRYSEEALCAGAIALSHELLGASFRAAEMEEELAVYRSASIGTPSEQQQKRIGEVLDSVRNEEIDLDSGV